MTLEVEDGTGKTNSESYESVAGADTYLTAFGLSWPISYSEGDKEIALRVGAQHLDQEYRTRLQGDKVTKEQALDWPRVDVHLFDGDFIVDSDEIPVDLMRANSHAGLAFATSTAGLNPDQTEPGRVKSEKIVIDVIEIATEWAPSKDDETQYTMVDRLMRQYLGQGNRAIRA